MKRLAVALLALALLAATPALQAQQPVGRVYRIGWLHPVSLPAVWVDGFRQGLQEHGYVEGRDLVIEYRWGDGRFERLPAMAADLLRLNVDVVISGNTTALKTLKDATRTIPIVMLAPGDPVATGLVSNLARPGGNITGLSGQAPELSGKRLELLKEVVPGLARIAFLSNPGNPAIVLAAQETREAAKALGVAVSILEIRGPGDFDPVLATIVRDRPGALVLPADTLIHGQRARIAEFALKQRLPSIAAWREFADAGGLMVYGVNIPDVFRRSVGYIDKILKGAKPADLPVEQPTKFELVINMKTAKALGLTIPQAVLVRADEVIR